MTPLVPHPSTPETAFGVVMVAIDEVVRQNGVDMPSASMLALSALERTRERCGA